MHTQLQNSDAWVMLSVLYEHGYTGEAISLAQIIGACDFIEHAIITYDELTGALVRLTSQQYITEAGALRFLPTSSYSISLTITGKQIKGLTYNVIYSS